MRSCIVFVVVLLASAAPAVTPAGWTHTTEKDFASGKFVKTVVNSRGEVSLARKVELLLDSKSAPAVVSALAVRDKVIYAAAGNEPVIYRIAGKKAAKFAKLPGTMVTALVVRGKDLLAGVGGKDAGIYVVDAKGKAGKLWSHEKVKYVWAIEPGPAGKLYAATGGEPKVYAVDAKGAAREIYDAGKLAKNILCLGSGRDGMLYAGTDQSGLVVEIDTRGKSSRIVLDADESEISAIVPDTQGGLYVSTADAAKASADGKVAPSGKGRTGKPTTAPGEGKAATKPAGKPAGKGKAGGKPGRGPAGKPAKASPAPLKPGDKVVIPVLIGRLSKPPTRPRPKGPPKPSDAKGNAVYYVRPDGLVRTIFRKPVAILAMQLRGDRLILGTGNGGTVYYVTTDGEETGQLVDTEARQITALARSGADLLFATANRGSVGRISESYAAKGTFSSKALDARQIVRWGTVRLRAVRGAKVTVATRSGNVKEPDEKTWSGWSKEQPVGDDFLAIMSPAARFLQYRLSLVPDGRESPSVAKVGMMYQMANLPPKVTGITFRTSSRADKPIPTGPQPIRFFNVQAADPNGDGLSMTIHLRRAGTKKWIRIAEKLSPPKFVWDTRTAGDGTYEIRVTVCDAPANTPQTALTGARIADPLLVDNTPPVVKALSARVKGDTIVLSGTIADATSRLTAIAYSVDSQDEWKAARPADGICDSTREKFSARIEDVKPGAHCVAVRASDRFKNVAYGYVNVTVGK